MPGRQLGQLASQPSEVNWKHFVSGTPTREEGWWQTFALHCWGPDLRLERPLWDSRWGEKAPKAQHMQNKIKLKWCLPDTYRVTIPACMNQHNDTRTILRCELMPCFCKWCQIRLDEIYAPILTRLTRWSSSVCDLVVVHLLLLPFLLQLPCMQVKISPFCYDLKHNIGQAYCVPIFSIHLGAFVCSLPKFSEKLRSQARKRMVPVRKRSWVQDGLWSE